MNEQSIKVDASRMLIMEKYPDACWAVCLPGRLMRPNVQVFEKGDENLKNVTVSRNTVNFLTNQDVI